MKKELFLLCALPYLLSAQNVEVKNVLKEKPIIQRLFKSLPVENQKQITTYAGAENNLPDSIFMYSDEDKKELASKTFITYDENERKSLVWSYSFYYWEDTVDSVLSKTVYLYTLKDGLLEIEATSKYYALDVWINYEKSVMVFRETDLNNPIEDHEYSYNEITLEWEPYLEMAAVEFDDENRPVVYDAENYETIMRIEVSYNENGLRNSVKSYIAMDIPEEPWQLNQEGELTYNDDLQLVKDVFYLYDMEETITGEYEYDEKGNLSYEITVFEGEGYREEFEAFYTNFYESVIDANEVI
ncbi:MAG: hypothetical protein LBE91_17570, partial [Tannerella sp.]|nr:hypothetical protein [Tannerella sp.]